MHHRHEYILQELDLDDKLILDAALGIGEATYAWARKVHQQGGKARIISIDLELPVEWRNKIELKLGDYAHYVELREGDIFCLDFLTDNSIDIINCDHTIVFLNPKPLKLLQAVQEFQRVLKPDGLLFITSEIPIPDHQDPENEGEWRRWNLARAVANLKGDTWSSEPLPAELTVALELFGFTISEQKIFPTEKNHQYTPCLTEWKQTMLHEIASIPWQDALKNALLESIHEVCHKVQQDGYLKTPSFYMLKCRKST
ncbi:class I SAM-dependent methyltransferase [candidate division CSSED10-310 bacterium]|uniref:Class I SAM-dependent methyltransferase n=1 Tax=candidate division CSSED10-310 bacterium TaxID=2855610 RepID=A0ABV6Z520_UNCC1